MNPFPPALSLFPKTVPEVVTVSLPGSKSYTNRALLLAALTRGQCTLHNALFSDDTERMSECLRALGIQVQADPLTRRITTQGAGRPTMVPTAPLYCGNAGTAIRFLLPYCAFGLGTVILTGNERMQQRPIADLLDGLRQLGGRATDLNRNGCPPIQITGGGLPGGDCTIEGSRSSQYFSALLLSAARMDKGLTIRVTGELVSRPYIEMTLSVMASFGIKYDHHTPRLPRQSGGVGWGETILIPAGQEPVPCEYTVEGDASAASYFLAAAALTGKTVRVEPIPANTCQGDIGFARILGEMGCTWHHAGDCLELTGGALKGIEVDLNAMSDTAQTLAVVALFAEGPTTIRNIANVRIKETDRIAALAREISRLGGKVTEYPDGLTIDPQDSYTPTQIETYDDHRMAMSFAVAGLRIPGLTLHNPGCVSKTFPTFFEAFSPWVTVS